MFLECRVLRLVSLPRLLVLRRVNFGYSQISGLHVLLYPQKNRVKMFRSQTGSDTF